MKKTTKVRWGLLSTARINRRVIPAIRSSPRGELAAVASRSKEQASDYARQWEIPQAYASYDAMLNSGTIDVVYISLPNHLHAEWTIRALNAGVHVLCEKPFATSLADVDAMIAAARNNDRHLAEAFMYRHHPQTLKAGEWVQAGRLGDVHLVRGVFNFLLTDRHNVRMVPEFGGGALWDVGVYPVSFAQWIFGGPPTQVAGFQVKGPEGVDDSFTGLMDYPSGRQSQFSCSFRSPYHTHLEIIGSHGRLELNRPFTGMEEDGKLLFIPENGSGQKISYPKMALYSGEIEDMHAAILDGKPNRIHLHESRNHIRTILALYESARSGVITCTDLSAGTT